MQTLELVGVAALLVIGYLLLRPWAHRFHHASPGLFWALAIVSAAGSVLALGLIVRGDFFPDRLEPVGRIALLIGVVGGGVLLSQREAG
jgi:hypothetical protein